MTGPGVAAKAGTMLSKNGSATAAPAPRKNVRRPRCSFLIIMTRVPSWEIFRRGQGSRHSLLERHAFDNTQNKRRPTIVVCRRLMHDRPFRRHVVILGAAAQSIGQQFVDESADEFLAAGQQQFTQVC